MNRDKKEMEFCPDHRVALFSMHLFPLCLCHFQQLQPKPLPVLHRQVFFRFPAKGELWVSQVAPRQAGAARGHIRAAANK